MKCKLYSIYNKRAETISNVIFMAKNDNEAKYMYEINDDRQIKENPYYRPNDYNLVCLGVIYTDKEDRTKGVGIDEISIHDFPYMFDEVKDGQKPIENESEDSTVYNENEKKKIIEEIRRGSNK